MVDLSHTQQVFDERFHTKLFSKKLSTRLGFGHHSKYVQISSIKIKYTYRQDCKKNEKKILWCPKPRRVDNFFENKNFTKFSYRNRYTFGKIKPNEFRNKKTSFQAGIRFFWKIKISFK